MSSSEVNSLMVGMEIDIRRTDGRIHSVIISSIDSNLKIVTVEWFEKGEAKGKEIDFVEVFQLNPNLAPSDFIQETAKPRILIKLDEIKETKSDTRSSNESQLPKLLGLAKSDNNMRKSSLIPFTSKKYIASELNSENESSYYEGGSTRNLPSISDLNPYGKSRPEKGIFKEIRTLVKRPQNRSQRRLTCVEHIEQIQVKREERRAVNKSQKLNEIDSSNPNFIYYRTILEYRGSNQIRKCVSIRENLLKKILVCVRKRPMNKKEISKKDIDIITVPSSEIINIHEPKVKVDMTKYMEHHSFRFDYVFDEECDNKFVYNCTTKPLVESIFKGGMATCFAYGQTGSGKTYTMTGEFLSNEDCVEGIYILAAKDVFEIKNEKYNDDVSIEISFFEIYGGKVYDLLNRKQKLAIFEDSKNQIQLVGLRSHTVDNIEDVIELLQIGIYIRTSGHTSANEKSSRSHAVFQIIVKKNDTNKMIGKFSLIDLAGSERGADTMSLSRNVRMQGAEINKSLLALKECIRALGRKGVHLPFRGSKLTLVLRDSFIGDNSRTCMIALVSPSIYSCEHTLNTLRYADRVKELCPDVKEISESQINENEKMKEKSPSTNFLSNESSTTEMVNDDQQIFDMTEEVNKLEDELISVHRDLIKEQFPNWYRNHKQLYNSTRKVDYNIDKYTSNLEEIVNNQIKVIKDMKEKLQNMMKSLQLEEEMNKIYLSKL